MGYEGVGVSGFVPVWGCLFLSLLRWVLGCWWDLLFDAVLGLLFGWCEHGAPLLRLGWRKLPKKKRPFGMLLFFVGGEIGEWRVKQNLRA